MVWLSEIGDSVHGRNKESQVNRYMELLVHYDAKLVKRGESVLVVSQKTGAELPLEHKGRLLMIKALLSEFGSVEAVNEEIEGYRASRP